MNPHLLRPYLVSTLLSVVFDGWSFYLYIENAASDVLISAASIVKPEPVEHVSTPDEGKEVISTQMDFYRPDALLGSDWFVHTPECGKDQSTVTDTIATLLGEDFCSDYKHMSAGASTLSQGLGLGSFAWNNMPAVCHLSEFP